MATINKLPAYNGEVISKPKRTYNYAENRANAKKYATARIKFTNWFNTVYTSDLCAILGELGELGKGLDDDEDLILLMKDCLEMELYQRTCERIK